MSTSQMKIKSIAPWFGGNRKLASHVGQELGQLAWAGIAFAGGMCELPHIKARTVVANDRHRHVINMARVMADRELGPTFYRKMRRYVLHPDAVIVAQQRCRVREELYAEHIALFKNDRDRFAESGEDEPSVWWAEDYFVSAWGSRSSAAGASDEFSTNVSLRWNADGGDSAVRFANAVRSIPAWRRALKRTSFSTLDAFAFFEKCKDAVGHGLYCDPPFPGQGQRYKFKPAKSDEVAFHEKLARAVQAFEKTRVVMRFYDHPMIRDMYPQSHWTWRHLTGRTQANKAASEVLLMNGPSYAALTSKDITSS